ncbi:hypothetical protein F5I97DRAFT_711388 [Phlebopus sp. FC_14]|nr:hypothetical protein F5I97DRAFT_711388 [Phlebopus sp. FC_14]
MLSFLTFALLFPVSLFARPLGGLDKQRLPTACVIADVSYSDPRHTFMLLTTRAISPPVGLSERTFGDLLIWCHEYGRSTSGLLLARQDTPSSCTSDSVTQGGLSSADGSSTNGAPSTYGGDAGPSGTGNGGYDSTTTSSDPNSTSSTSTEPAQGDGGSPQSVAQSQAPPASGDGSSSAPASGSADSQSGSSTGSGSSPTSGADDGTTTTSSSSDTNSTPSSSNQGCPPGTVVDVQGQAAGVFICVSV